jgi:hypothetical protein
MCPLRDDPAQGCDNPPEEEWFIGPPSKVRDPESALCYRSEAEYRERMAAAKMRVRLARVRQGLPPEIPREHLERLWDIMIAALRKEGLDPITLQPLEQSPHYGRRPRKRR